MNTHFSNPTARLATLLLFTLGFAPINAATLYYGGGTADITDGTSLPTDRANLTGDWDTTTQNWATDTAGTTYTNWDNSDTTAEAFFGSGVTASNGTPTVTLQEAISVNRITLDLSGLGGFNQAVVLDGSQTITFVGTDPTLSAVAANFRRIIFESGVSLVSANGMTRTGNNGGQFYIRGDADGILGTWTNEGGYTRLQNSGSLAGVTQFDLKSGEFEVSNSTGANDRLNDNLNVELKGAQSTFDYQGVRNNSNPSTETMGKITLESHGRLNLNSSSGSGNNGTLILSDATSGIDRGMDGKGTLIVGIDEGATELRTDVEVQNGVATGQILPWMVTSDSRALQLNGATNKLEIVAMDSAPTDLSTWVAGSNYLYDADVNPTNQIGTIAINTLGIHDSVGTGNNSTTFNIGASDTLTLTQGLLALSRGDSFGATNIDGGKITSGNGELYIHSTDDGNAALDISSELTGSMDVIVASAGTVDFDGSVANTYVGTTYVTAGTLNLNKADNVTSVTGDVFIGHNATLAVNNDEQIASGATVTIRDGGTLNHGDFDNQTYDGQLIIDGGRWNLGAVSFSDVTGAGTGLVFNGGEVTASNTNFNNPVYLLTDVSYASSSEEQAIWRRPDNLADNTRSLFLTKNAGDATRTFNVADSSTLDADTPEMVIEHAIRELGGIGSLTKTGDGTLVLAADTGHGGNGNLYTGTTTVAAGTLLVNNPVGSGTGTGSVVVQSGATLGGTGTIAPDGADGLTAQSGSTVAPGASIGTLSFDLSNTTGGLVFDAGAGFLFELDAPGTSDVLSILGYNPGDVTFNNNIIDFINLGGLAAGTYTLFSFDAAHGLSSGLVIGSGLTGATANLDFASDPNLIQLNVTSVIPEPNAIIMLGLGLAAALGLRRRRSLITG